LVFVKEEIANSQNLITTDEMNGIAILEFIQSNIWVQKPGSNSGGLTADSVKIIAEYFIAKE
jgi:hypothetical protein